MTRWFNPRMFVVAITIVVLMQVSQVGESHETIRRGLIACAVLLVMYILAFLAPLWRTLGFKSIVWPGITLCAGWTAIALALIADALPRTLAERMEHRINWPMMASCVAGTAAFFLFFQSVARSLRLREDILAARNSRD